MSESGAVDPAGSGTDPAGATGDPTPGTGEGPQDPGTQESNEPDLAAQVAHWKEMARKNEGRARANADAADKLAKLEDANKTEVQRAQDEAAQARRERDEARADHSRVMAAAAHNLPVDLIDDLGSGTDEEIAERAERFNNAIESRAQEIAAQIIADGRNGQQNGQQQNGRPVESLRPGGAPSTGGTPTSPDDAFRLLISGNQ